MTLTSRDRILLGAIVALVAVFGYYHFAFAPARREASQLETQVTAARTSLVRAQQRYATGRAASSSLRSAAPTFAAAQRAVPNVSDVPGLLRLLQRSAQDAHVSVESIALGAGSSTSTTPGEATSPAGPTTSAVDATEIPVTLVFDGGYQALHRLIDHLDGLVTLSGRRVHAVGPLVGISNVTLSNGTVTLTAVVYQHAAATTVIGPSPEGTS